MSNRVARLQGFRPPRCNDPTNESTEMPTLLWPSVNHEAMGGVRVDGEPVHFSKTDWSINRATPTLGQDNQRVFGDILGLSTSEIEQLTEDGVL